MTNPDQLVYPGARSVSFFFHRQIWHLLSLLILTPLAWWLAAPQLGRGAWLGIPAANWFWASVILSIVHQEVVWIVFRLQLGWATLTRLFGKADLFIWGLIFMPLFASRVVTVVGLARSTGDTLALARPLAVGLVAILIIPALYTLWSVLRYFGLTRAMVGDHFRLRYRQMPLENRGVFRYSDNAMYAYGFLILWAIALFNLSLPALVAAVFQHLYIWVHYYCTEKPDMDMIYRNPTI